MRVAGVTPEAFPAELGSGFLQDPEGQKGLLFVFRCIELDFFGRRQNFVCQLQIDLSVQFFCIDGYIASGQYTKSMLGCVRYGKMPGTVRKVRLAPVRYQNFRQGLSGLCPVKLLKELTSGLVSGASG